MKRPIETTQNRRAGRLANVFGLAVAGLILTLPVTTFAEDQQTFESPDAAIAALTNAAESHDTNAMHLIFGPEGRKLVSPDVVQATDAFERFVQRIQEKVELVTNSDTSIRLDLGADAWPFPIPLVSQDGHWFFDTAAGATEILNRRIGKNELGAIDVCRAYVDAQREYASEDRMGDGVLAYAKYLRSTPGTRDGLFWPAKEDEPLSPFGPLIAAARGEGYHRAASMINDERAPYHGYYFKVLTGQGKHAPGGKYDYIINGRMIAGFGLVAWPAEWANTGVMTFIVNQQGKVYQANLGKKTAKIAAAITRFDPDDKWTPVP